MPFARVWDSSCPRVWDQWEKDGLKWVIQDIPPEDDEKIVKIMTTKFLVDEIMCATVEIMPFARVWDSSCPRVWDQWEKDGLKWVIQDIPPEDDEKIVKIMTTKFLVDEIMCATVGVTNDPVSMAYVTETWRNLLKQRVSLGCYVLKDGVKTLAGLNCCMIKSKDDPELQPEGEAWSQITKAMAMMEESADVFQLIGDDKYLSCLGLYVKREFRGAGLGRKILEAREPLCKHIGVKGSVTVFSGPASQKSAENAGYTTYVTMTLKDYAEAGLRYPANDTKVICTWKKY